MTAVSQVLAQLAQLADLAEIRGAADAADLRNATASLARLTDDDLSRLTHRAHRTHSEILPGAQRRIREVALGGGDGALRAARARIPLLMRRLLELTAATTHETAQLATMCGVATLADLETALDDGRVERTLGALSAARLTSAAEALARELPPLPLGRAIDALESIKALLEAQCASLCDVAIAGDARRHEALVAGLVVVAWAADPVAAIAQVCAASGIDDVLCRTSGRAVVLWQEAEIDVRVAVQAEYGSVLFAATGARQHVRAVTERRGRRTICPGEEDVYRKAGLQFIAPELRHGTGEVEAASSKALPTLVERTDIRGDLHMHTTYSDGQDTLETMVAACVQLGHAYIAITDHSESAAASRTLSLDQLTRQRDEIERLRPRYPDITILHGVEVDILTDGRLDFPDAILERLDIVLASLHDAAGQDGAALTRRCIRAIRHPLVNVITHPANRLVGRRAGYPLDFDAVYAAAADTGTALEIDGAPSHLDLDGEHARAAVTAGATVTIDSDCHRAKALGRQMLLGVGTARRGWVEKRHVLNARPLEEVRAFIRAKRDGKRQA
ncbi:MAG: PHP domain-containing protein [Acidobacteria bacterium]|nr:PHP domain-containing protein [Acidobacteriota bacterium]